MIILQKLEYKEEKMMDFLMAKALLRHPQELKFLRELPYQSCNYMWDDKMNDKQFVKTSIWTPGIYRLKPNQTVHRLWVDRYFLTLVPEIISALHNIHEHKRTPFQALINKVIYFNPKHQYIGSENLIKYFKILEYAYDKMNDYWSASIPKRALLYDDYTSEMGVCFTDALEYYKLVHPGVQYG